jgi:amidohydrolase
MKEALIEQFEDKLDGHAEEIVSLRRHLHRYPELSNQEFRTTSLLTERLSAAGFEVHVRPEGTGFFADLTPAGFSPETHRTVAIRADLDALPIHEMTGLEFASEVPNVMHACGHDVHMSVVTAIGIAANALELPGRLRLIFQHSEESIPGGALDMVAMGAVEGVDYVLGMHVDPELEVGKIGVKSGAFTAAFDTFRFEITGKSGHGARPHHCVDPIYVLTQVANALYQAFGRRLDARDPTVFSIGMINAGTAPNIIPETATMSGSVRTLSQAQRDQVPDLLHQVAAGICAAHGATYALDLIHGAPAIINNPDVCDAISAATVELLGAQSLHHIALPSMGSEDFSVYLQDPPGAMCRVGVARADQPKYFLHSAHFAPDESALLIAAKVLGRAALTLMTSSK